MNRLTNTLEDLKNKSKKALVAYLVAGDPDIETTLELMTVLVESGVDIIEIGVPFTDPIAEGPIIQKAHDRALKNNVSLKSIFEMVEKFRKSDNDTPLVLMGYLNTFIFNKALIEDNKNGIPKILSNIISSQFDIHKEFGGVVPDLAARSHLEKIDLIVKKAIEQSGISLEKISAVATTVGPGLIVCLTVGLNFGKAMASSLNLPLLSSSAFACAITYLDSSIADKYSISEVTFEFTTFL